MCQTLAIGGAGAAAAATVPDPPTGVEAFARLRSVLVDWTAPSNNGGSAITKYLVTASPGGAVCSTTKTKCTVGRLTPGTAYSLVVVAINAVGRSTPSAAVSAVPLDLPGAPTDVVMESSTLATDGITARIHWLPPAKTGGSPLTRFTVAATPGDSRCSVATTQKTPRTSCKLLGLKPRTAYTVAANARTLAGTGPWSAPSATLYFDVPRAPTDARVTPLIKAAKVSWTAPVNQGNLPLQGYRVTSTPDGLTCTTPETQTSCTVTGLRELAVYSFTVTASNPLGVSLPSAPSPQIFPAAPPPPPVTGLIATTTFDAAGAPTIRLTWLAAPGLVGASSRISYLPGGTPPPSLSTGSKVAARRVAARPGDTGPRYSASVPASAVRSPLAISVFMIGSNKRASTPVSIVLTRPGIFPPVLRIASASRPVVLRWQLTGAGGAALPGLPVTVLVRRAGTVAWTARPLVTDAGGWATMRSPFAGLTDISFVFKGGNTTIGVSLPVVQLRVASALSAQLSVPTARRRAVVRLTGVVLPRKPGQAVYLQLLVGNVWRSVAVMRSDTLGRYGFLLPTATRGLRRYRAYVRGDLQNVSGASGQRILNVV